MQFKMHPHGEFTYTLKGKGKKLTLFHIDVKLFTWRLKKRSGFHPILWASSTFIDLWQRSCHCHSWLLALFFFFHFPSLPPTLNLILPIKSRGPLLFHCLWTKPLHLAFLYSYFKFLNHTFFHVIFKPVCFFFP